MSKLQQAGTRSQRRRSRRRPLFIAAYLLFVVLLLFVAVRVVLMFRANQSFDGSMEEIDVWTFYYPELRNTGALTDSDDEKYFDVLFLGGSVLQQVARKTDPADFGDIAPVGMPVRIYDLSKSAHTTRDSLLKFRQLQHRSFDLIVVYHGINDVRMNCCKKDMFKADYTHCEWYRSMVRRVAEKRISLTDIVSDTASQFIDLGEPPRELLAEGRELKTGPAFRANLSELVNLARSATGTTVVLGTFGLCLPTDYTSDKFKSGDMGYADGDYQMHVESWAEPDVVRAGVSMHNKAVRDIANQTGAVLMDANLGLGDDLSLFCDPCHLSGAGIARLEHLLLSSLGAGE